ncbi:MULTISPECIES: TatD family hydrolase [unclassified Luteococcus]|uniref:TatD family hydrolase n=1 Tax=unclassified Luteococcus TaxID=2639923 RepID=UPI00313B3D74
MDIPARLAELKLPPLPEPLPSPVIDSHTHLDATQEYSGLDVETNLAAARAVGIERVVEVGCDVASSRTAAELAARYPQVVAAVAMHPNDAARSTTLEQDIAQIDALAGAGHHVRAVGETGLDHYRTTDEALHAVQEHSFVAHIQIARRHGKTLVIHHRDAHADLLRVLAEQDLPERTLMHCFSGDADFARACLAHDDADHGMWLSFPGVVTYKNAPYLSEALKVTPRNRILVETDAPYLTPVPARGKANAPYLVPHTLRFMADVLGMGLDELCRQVRSNTVEAFGGEWGSDA